MSEHLLDSVPHDDGRSGAPLLARHGHVAEPTTLSVDTNSRSGDRVPAGVSGQAGRGAVGTAAPAGRLSPLVRAAAYAYLAVALAVAILAFTFAPWGLLLLPVAVAIVAVAFLLQLMAAGLETIEEDES